MRSHRLIRFTPVVVAAVIVPFLLFAFDAAAGTQRARNGTAFSLPYTTGSGWAYSVPLFEIRQQGSGSAGRFAIENPDSFANALNGVTSGNGHALLALNTGYGRGAVISISKPANTSPALSVSTSGIGSSTLASAVDVKANNTQAIDPAMQVTTEGKGGVLRVNNNGPVGSLATFQTGGVNRIRLSHDGGGSFSDEVRTASHGVTETLQPEGSISGYSPGDVLVISTATDERVAKSNQTYSKRVIGVYARSSGVLLTNRSIDASLSDTLQVGILGVFPTRVTAANGPISRGDLLVTSATPGAAMRASTLVPGTIVGKAMGEFSGAGTAVIPALISLQ